MKPMPFRATWGVLRSNPWFHTSGHSHLPSVDNNGVKYRVVLRDGKTYRRVILIWWFLRVAMSCYFYDW
eukprot:5105814-Pyramimonas_sp.AAC.2